MLMNFDLVDIFLSKFDELFNSGSFRLNIFILIISFRGEFPES